MGTPVKRTKRKMSPVFSGAPMSKRQCDKRIGVLAAKDRASTSASNVPEQCTQNPSYRFTGCAIVSVSSAERCSGLVSVK
jgi:hypothetical protein